MFVGGGPDNSNSENCLPRVFQQSFRPPPRRFLCHPTAPPPFQQPVLRQEAAWGNLRAGQYFLGKDDSWATHYLTRSVELFRDWGAQALARHWEEKYAGFIDPSRRMTQLDSQQRTNGRFRLHARW